MKKIKNFHFDKKEMHMSGKYFCFPESTIRAPVSEPEVFEPEIKPAIVKKQVKEIKGYKYPTMWWTWLIPLLILGLLLWLLLSWLKKPSAQNKGRVIVAATSAPALTNIIPGGLTKATANIDGIQALYSGGKGKSTQWINLPSTSRTVDLIAMRNAPNLPIQILSDTQIPAGIYDKLRFIVSKVNIEDAQGGKTVITTGKDIELPIRPFEVKSDASASVVLLNISLDDSVRNALDESGQPVKIFAPFVTYETLESVPIRANGKPDIQQGKSKLSGTIGTDINGKTGRDLGVPRDARLKVVKGKVVYSEGLAPQVSPPFVEMPPMPNLPSPPNLAVPPVQPSLQPQLQPLAQPNIKQPSQAQTCAEEAVQVPQNSSIQPEGLNVNQLKYYLPAFFHGKPNRA